MGVDIMLGQGAAAGGVVGGGSHQVVEVLDGGVPAHESAVPQLGGVGDGAGQSLFLLVGAGPIHLDILEPGHDGLHLVLGHRRGGGGLVVEVRHRLLHGLGKGEAVDGRLGGRAGDGHDDHLGGAGVGDILGRAAPRRAGVHPVLQGQQAVDEVQTGLVEGPLVGGDGSHGGVMVGLGLRLIVGGGGQVGVGGQQVAVGGLLVGGQSGQLVRARPGGHGGVIGGHSVVVSDLLRGLGVDGLIPAVPGVDQDLVEVVLVLPCGVQGRVGVGQGPAGVVVGLVVVLHEQVVGLGLLVDGIALVEDGGQLVDVGVVEGLGGDAAGVLAVAVHGDAVLGGGLGEVRHHAGAHRTEVIGPGLLQRLLGLLHGLADDVGVLHQVVRQGGRRVLVEGGRAVLETGAAADGGLAGVVLPIGIIALAVLEHHVPGALVELHQAGVLGAGEVVVLGGTLQGGPVRRSVAEDAVFVGAQEIEVLEQILPSGHHGGGVGTGIDGHAGNHIVVGLHGHKDDLVLAHSGVHHAALIAGGDGAVGGGLDHHGLGIGRHVGGGAGAHKAVALAAGDVEHPVGGEDEHIAVGEVHVHGVVDAGDLVGIEVIGAVAAGAQHIAGALAPDVHLSPLADGGGGVAVGVDPDDLARLLGGAQGALAVHVLHLLGDVVGRGAGVVAVEAQGAGGVQAPGVHGAVVTDRQVEVGARGHGDDVAHLGAVAQGHPLVAGEEGGGHLLGAHLSVLVGAPGIDLAVGGEGDAVLKAGAQAGGGDEPVGIIVEVPLRLGQDLDLHEGVELAGGVVGHDLGVAHTVEGHLAVLIHRGHGVVGGGKAVVGHQVEGMLVVDVEAVQAGGDGAAQLVETGGPGAGQHVDGLAAALPVVLLAGVGQVHPQGVGLHRVLGEGLPGDGIPADGQLAQLAVIVGAPGEHVAVAEDGGGQAGGPGLAVVVQTAVAAAGVHGHHVPDGVVQGAVGIGLAGPNAAHGVLAVGGAVGADAQLAGQVVAGGLDGVVQPVGGVVESHGGLAAAHPLGAVQGAVVLQGLHVGAGGAAVAQLAVCLRALHIGVAGPGAGGGEEEASIAGVELHRPLAGGHVAHAAVVLVDEVGHMVGPVPVHHGAPLVEGPGVAGSVVGGGHVHDIGLGDIAGQGHGHAAAQLAGGAAAPQEEVTLVGGGVGHALLLAGAGDDHAGVHVSDLHAVVGEQLHLGGRGVELLHAAVVQVAADLAHADLAHVVAAEGVHSALGIHGQGEVIPGGDLHDLGRAHDGGDGGRVHGHVGAGDLVDVQMVAHIVHGVPAAVGLQDHGAAQAVHVAGDGVLGELHHLGLGLQAAGGADAGAKLAVVVAAPGPHGAVGLQGQDVVLANGDLGVGHGLAGGGVAVGILGVDVGLHHGDPDLDGLALAGGGVGDGHQHIGDARSVGGQVAHAVDGRGAAVGLDGDDAAVGGGIAHRVAARRQRGVIIELDITLSAGNQVEALAQGEHPGHVIGRAHRQVELVAVALQGEAGAHLGGPGGEGVCLILALVAGLEDIVVAEGVHVASLAHQSGVPAAGRGGGGQGLEIVDDGGAVLEHGDDAAGAAGVAVAQLALDPGAAHDDPARAVDVVEAGAAAGHQDVVLPAGVVGAGGGLVAHEGGALHEGLVGGHDIVAVPAPAVEAAGDVPGHHDGVSGLVLLHLEEDGHGVLGAAGHGHGPVGQDGGAGDTGIGLVAELIVGVAAPGQDGAVGRQHEGGGVLADGDLGHRAGGSPHGDGGIEGGGDELGDLLLGVVAHAEEVVAHVEALDLVGAGLGVEHHPLVVGALDQQAEAMVGVDAAGGDVHDLLDVAVGIGAGHLLAGLHLGGVGHLLPGVLAQAQLAPVVAAPGPDRAVVLQRVDEVAGGGELAHVIEGDDGALEDCLALGVLAHHLGDVGHDLLGRGVGAVEGADAQLAVLVGAPGPHGAVHRQGGGEAGAGDHLGEGHAVAPGGVGSLEGDPVLRRGRLLPVGGCAAASPSRNDGCGIAVELVVDALVLAAGDAAAADQVGVHPRRGGAQDVIVPRADLHLEGAHDERVVGDRDDDIGGAPVLAGNDGLLVVVLVVHLDHAVFADLVARIGVGHTGPVGIPGLVPDEPGQLHGGGVLFHVVEDVEGGQQRLVVELEGLSLVDGDQVVLQDEVGGAHPHGHVAGGGGAVAQAAVAVGAVGPQGAVLLDEVGVVVLGGDIVGHVDNAVDVLAGHACGANAHPAGYAPAAAAHVVDVLHVGHGALGGDLLAVHKDKAAGDGIVLVPLAVVGVPGHVGARAVRAQDAPGHAGGVADDAPLDPLLGQVGVAPLGAVGQDGVIDALAVLVQVRALAQAGTVDLGQLVVGGQLLGGIVGLKLAHRPQVGAGVSHLEILGDVGRHREGGVQRHGDGIARQVGGLLGAGGLVQEELVGGVDLVPQGVGIPGDPVAVVVLIVSAVLVAQAQRLEHGGQGVGRRLELGGGGVGIIHGIAGGVDLLLVVGLTGVRVHDFFQHGVTRDDRGVPVPAVGVAGVEGPVAAVAAAPGLHLAVHGDGHAVVDAAGDHQGAAVQHRAVGQLGGGVVASVGAVLVLAPGHHLAVLLQQPGVGADLVGGQGQAVLDGGGQAVDLDGQGIGRAVGVAGVVLRVEDAVPVGAPAPDGAVGVQGQRVLAHGLSVGVGVAGGGNVHDGGGVPGGVVAQIAAGGALRPVDQGGGPISLLGQGAHADGAQAVVAPGVDPAVPGQGQGVVGAGGDLHDVGQRLVAVSLGVVDHDLLGGDEHSGVLTHAQLAEVVAAPSPHGAIRLQGQGVALAGDHHGIDGVAVAAGGGGDHVELEEAGVAPVVGGDDVGGAHITGLHKAGDGIHRGHQLVDRAEGQPAGHVAVGTVSAEAQLAGDVAQDDLELVAHVDGGGQGAVGAHQRVVAHEGGGAEEEGHVHRDTAGGHHELDVVAGGPLGHPHRHGVAGAALGGGGDLGVIVDGVGGLDAHQLPRLGGEGVVVGQDDAVHRHGVAGVAARLVGVGDLHGAGKAVGGAGVEVGPDGHVVGGHHEGGHGGHSAAADGGGHRDAGGQGEGRNLVVAAGVGGGGPLHEPGLGDGAAAGVVFHPGVGHHGDGDDAAHGHALAGIPIAAVDQHPKLVVHRVVVAGGVHTHVGRRARQGHQVAGGGGSAHGGHFHVDRDAVGGHGERSLQRRGGDGGKGGVQGLHDAGGVVADHGGHHGVLGGVQLHHHGDGVPRLGGDRGRRPAGSPQAGARHGGDGGGEVQHGVVAGHGAAAVEDHAGDVQIGAAAVVVDHHGQLLVGVSAVAQLAAGVGAPGVDGAEVVVVGQGEVAVGGGGDGHDAVNGGVGVESVGLPGQDIARLGALVHPGGGGVPQVMADAQLAVGVVAGGADGPLGEGDAVLLQAAGGALVGHQAGGPGGDVDGRAGIHGIRGDIPGIEVIAVVYGGHGDVGTHGVVLRVAGVQDILDAQLAPVVAAPDHHPALGVDGHDGVVAGGQGHQVAVDVALGVGGAPGDDLGGTELAVVIAAVVVNVLAQRDHVAAAGEDVGGVLIGGDVVGLDIGGQHQIHRHPGVAGGPRGIQLAAAVGAHAVHLAVAGEEQGVIPAGRDIHNLVVVAEALGADQGGGGDDLAVEAVAQAQLAVAVVTPGQDGALAGQGQGEALAHGDLGDDPAVHALAQDLDRRGGGGQAHAGAHTQLSIGVVAKGPDRTVVPQDHGEVGARAQHRVDQAVHRVRVGGGRGHAGLLGKRGDVELEEAVVLPVHRAVHVGEGGHDVGGAEAHGLHHGIHAGGVHHGHGLVQGSPGQARHLGAVQLGGQGTVDEVEALLRDDGEARAVQGDDVVHTDGVFIAHGLGHAVHQLAQVEGIVVLVAAHQDGLSGLGAAAAAHLEGPQLVAAVVAPAPDGAVAQQRSAVGLTGGDGEGGRHDALLAAARGELGIDGPHGIAGHVVLVAQAAGHGLAPGENLALPGDGHHVVLAHGDVEHVGLSQIQRQVAVLHRIGGLDLKGRGALGQLPALQPDAQLAPAVGAPGPHGAVLADGGGVAGSGGHLPHVVDGGPDGHDLLGVVEAQAGGVHADAVGALVAVAQLPGAVGAPGKDRAVPVQGHRVALPRRHRDDVGEVAGLVDIHGVELLSALEAGQDPHGRQGVG